MARNQLDNAKLEVFRDITDDVEESDFVPYACLFDPHTLLTKNGELLQIIKITGFTYEALEHSDADLRQVIRKAVARSIPGNEYAIWFTTIRRKKRLSPDGEYPDEFSHKLHEAWKERNQWDRKYINELYVTIVREGQNADITSVKGFFAGLWPPYDRKQRNHYLERIAQELNATVEHMLALLQEFGAKRLGIVRRDGRYYGEHLEFLEKLINLEERPMPVIDIGLSEYLTSGEITFAYNAMEVRSAEGDRRFGAVLTIKEYKEASLYRLDEFLQLPCEFIVTQCLDFVNAKQALKSYEDQFRYLKLGQDRELAEKTELTQILKNVSGMETGFGEQQTTIFIIGTSVSGVERQIKQVRDALARIGIVTIREDIRFEETYWAMLPANFEFVKRLHYVNTQRIAGFVNIQNYPAGNARGCPWGPPVTLFYTAAGTPYFFNFHYQDNGHTLIAGPHGSGKSVLMNFLLAEARKYRNRLFYLDAHGHAGAFVKSIGGSYYDLADVNSTYHHLSPLSLPDNPSNREFLVLWLGTLIDPTGHAVTPDLLTACKQAVETLYQREAGQRRLSVAAQQLQASHPEAAQQLAPWCEGGELAYYFDHADESVAPSHGIIGFNLSGLIDQPKLLVPMASYLLHRITMTFDGTPSIIVLDEAWRLLSNPMFAPRVTPWLSYLTSKNALAVMATEYMAEAAEYTFCQDITAQAVTQIFLPDDDPDDYYQSAFGLSDEEYAYLDAMSVEYRHFMLKRRNETIIAELNLGGMDELLAVLSGIPQEEEAQNASASPAPVAAYGGA